MLRARRSVGFLLGVGANGGRTRFRLAVVHFPRFLPYAISHGRNVAKCTISGPKGRGFRAFRFYSASSSYICPISCHEKTRMTFLWGNARIIWFARRTLVSRVALRRRRPLLGIDFAEVNDSRERQRPLWALYGKRKLCRTNFPFRSADYLNKKAGVTMRARARDTPLSL